MTDRRVRFTATARRHVTREHTWWLENRDYRELFATEVEQAVRVLGCHLYYTFDDHQVIVRALWGARRERGPALR